MKYRDYETRILKVLNMSILDDDGQPYLVQDMNRMIQVVKQNGTPANNKKQMSFNQLGSEQRPKS